MGIRKLRLACSTRTWDHLHSGGSLCHYRWVKEDGWEGEWASHGTRGPLPVVP